MRTNFRKDENWPHPAAGAGDLPETGEVNLSRQHLEPAGAGLTPSSQSVLATSTPDVSSSIPGPPQHPLPRSSRCDLGWPLVVSPGIPARWGAATAQDKDGKALLFGGSNERGC